MTTARGTRREAFGPVEWGLMVFLALTWGASFVLIAVGLDAFEPGVVTMLRVGLGAVTLAFFPGARRPIDRADWPRLAVIAATWTALPFTLFPVAQQWINSAVAGMLNGAMPILAALVASLLLRSLPGRTQAIGLGVGFVGGWIRESSGPGSPAGPKATLWRPDDAGPRGGPLSHSRSRGFTDPQ